MFHYDPNCSVLFYLLMLYRTELKGFRLFKTVLHYKYIYILETIIKRWCCYRQTRPWLYNTGRGLAKD